MILMIILLKQNNSIDEEFYSLVLLINPFYLLICMLIDINYSKFNILVKNYNIST